MTAGSVCTSEIQSTAADVSFIAEHPRSAVTLLSQYLVRCPACQSVAAVHVDDANPAARVIVRFVCAKSCQVEESSVWLLLPAPAATAPDELVA